MFSVQMKCWSQQMFVVCSSNEAARDRCWAECSVAFIWSCVAHRSWQSGWWLLIQTSTSSAVLDDESWLLLSCAEAAAPCCCAHRSQCTSVVSHTPLPTQGPEEHPQRIHNWSDGSCWPREDPTHLCLFHMLSRWWWAHTQCAASNSHQLCLQHYTLMLLLQVEVSDTHEHLSE